MRFLASWYHRRALAASDRDDVDGAIVLYEKAIRMDPSWSAPWFNLGLIAKRRRDWKGALRYNQQASRLDPSDEPTWWNLGIAATALSDWTEARRAWSKYGIELPPGTGEIVSDLGPTPIRINPDGDGEVIWSRRIDPARAVITSVPLPESGHRHQDLLLHDGAPNGYRMVDGHEVAVFDEIEVLKPSRLGTFEARVHVGDAEDLAALEQTFDAAGAAAEDWSSIRHICKQCSEGRPHEGHHAEPPDVAGEHRIGIAAAGRDLAADLLRAWSAGGPSRVAGEVTILLPPPA
jgi:hypothetical protein